MKRIQWGFRIALAALCGCGSGPRLVPVSGTITKDGKPQAAVTVVFLPEQSNEVNTPGIGLTDLDGSYRLRWQDQSGVAPGKYRVTISPDVAPPSVAKVPQPIKDVPGKENLPSRPGQPKKTAAPRDEFSAEVTDKGGTFDFKIKG